MIEVIEGCGEWFVRVISGGHHTVSSYRLRIELFAHAERHRRRLGVVKGDTL